ncbi:GNAT family N-acetyltransferase [Saccharomonospora cyanea]|uniref:Sortase-like acyltransferase n=1 Tax=Saccharomonospora cyanea NA-134 TaxID=882082 RepID=H5XCC6_9PSEU|nr:GNAT family N-acetyltransferase [Saccharomonospora cyanea]EHR59132.1 sortase-like acyltransferase [Saccharomonospora cyanea NA-134]
MADGVPRVRLASESDAEALLRWRNDPDTRRWSRNTAEVALADHLAWLRGVLASEGRLLLVAENDAAERVGMVRFDRIDAGTWEVSITVAPEHRGTRLARPLLAEGERELRRRRSPGTVLATVHRDNTASVALFRTAGYAPDGTDGTDTGFLRFVKAVSSEGQ